MSNIQTEKPVHAEATAIIAPDGLKASLKLKAPENGGNNLSYELIKIFLAKNRIVFGLDEDALRSLADQPVYDTEVVVARGVPSEGGVDAQLIYYIDTNRQLRPKEKEDGSVDFKDLGTIQEAKKGQLLCEKIAAIPGKPGTDVRMANIACAQVKDAELPVGQNTVVPEEDPLKLYAGLDGHVTVINGKINILNAFNVNGNVSVETGNIDFSGNVVVKGDVASGFSIRADGDVTINGVAEAASITAGGTLIIRGGFLGGDSGVLNVTGNALCKFIESGTVNVGGNLETTYIMNATVRCGGAVNLTGRGLIRGGFISARTSVTANLIGSPKASSANTTIEVGNDSTLLQRYEQMQTEIEETAKQIGSLETLAEAMGKAKAAGQLAASKMAELEKITAALATLQPAHESRLADFATLESQVERLGNGTVNVRRTAYTGLKIIIGDESQILQADHERVSFYREQDGIAFVPLMNEFA